MFLECSILTQKNLLWKFDMTNYWCPPRSPPLPGDRHIVFVLSGSLSVTKSREHVLLLHRFSNSLETLYNALLPFVDVHIVRSGGSSYFPSSYGGSNRGRECKIACEQFTFYMIYQIDLKLCTMLHCHLKMCVLSGKNDPNYFPSSYGGSNRGGGVILLVNASSPLQLIR